MNFNNLLTLLITMLICSCVESKKEAGGASAQSSGTKYFVSEEEIQVLNQVFTNQFQEVASELILANNVSVRTESLLSGDKGIVSLESDNVRQL